MDTRYFPFATKREVNNTFHGERRFVGLSNDAEGKSMIDRHAFSGWMSERRLREWIRSSPQKRDIQFLWDTGRTERLPASTVDRPVIMELSAAELLRNLDNLSADQCSACKSWLGAPTGGFSSQRHCSCGYHEFANGLYVGKVDEVDSEHNMLWVESSQLVGMKGCPAFVDAQQVGDYVVGTDVLFRLSADSEAVDVRPLRH